MQDQTAGAAGSPAGWAPEVVREQLQAFRSSDDLLSFFTELKDLVHVSDTRCNGRKTPLCHILLLTLSGCRPFALQTSSASPLSSRTSFM